EGRQVLDPVHEEPDFLAMPAPLGKCRRLEGRVSPLQAVLRRKDHRVASPWFHREPVSVNSFLDTCRPKIRLPQPRYTVARVSPGQGLCIRAAQSATSHCIDAETRAAPSGVLPRYQSSGAITDFPSAFG